MQIIADKAQGARNSRTLSERSYPCTIPTKGTVHVSAVQVNLMVGGFSLNTRKKFLQMIFLSMQVFKNLVKLIFSEKKYFQVIQKTFFIL